MGKRLGDGLGPDARDTMQVVEQLQLAQRSPVQQMRSVMQVQAELTVRPADSAARIGEALIGKTRELRSGDTVAVFPVPVVVGSFFQLVFEAGVLDLPPVFARCDRCAMLSEHEFEVRFHFLQPVTLPTSVGTPGN